MPDEESTDRVAALEARVAALELSVGRLTLSASSSPAALAYPEPLATPLVRESGAGLHHEKFFSLLDAGEACLQYTGAMVIALCKSGGREFDPAQEFRQPLSLGRWADLIRSLLAWEGLPDNSISQAMKSSILRPNGRFTPSGRYLLDEFIAIRNRERGHGSSLPDEAYGTLRLRHSAELLDALRSFTYLAYPLVRIESVNIVTDPFSYDVRLLVGPPPLTSTERIQSAIRLPMGAVCVWDQVDGLLDLGGLVTYRSCPICNLEHTFFLERWDNNARHYHSYFGNHRYTE